MSPLLLVHLTATVFMTGLIWFTQVVHYPLFGRVCDDVFADYHRAHTQRTSLVVVPPMAVELLTALWLVTAPPGTLPAGAAEVGLALLGVVWSSTAFLQVPRHARLAEGYDAGLQRGLVATNWLRTAAWTGRAAVAIWMVASAAA